MILDLPDLLKTNNPLYSHCLMPNSHVHFPLRYAHTCLNTLAALIDTNNDAPHDEQYRT